jgi:hypothetical protein
VPEGLVGPRLNHARLGSTVVDTVSSDRSIADGTNFQATAAPLGKNVVEAAQAQNALDGAPVLGSIPPRIYSSP